MKKTIIILISFLMISSQLFTPIARAQSNEEFTDMFHALSEELIETVSPYIELTDNSFEIRNLEILKEKISNEEFELVMNVIDETNSILKESVNIEKVEDSFFVTEITDLELILILEEAGLLSPDEYIILPVEPIIYYEISDPLFDYIYLDDNHFTTSSTWSYNGVTRLYYKWWGVELWLSKNAMSMFVGVTIAVLSAKLNALFPGIAWVVGIAVWSAFVSNALHPMVFGIRWNRSLAYFGRQVP